MKLSKFLLSTILIIFVVGIGKSFYGYSINDKR